MSDHDRFEDCQRCSPGTEPGSTFSVTELFNYRQLSAGQERRALSAENINAAIDYCSAADRERGQKHHREKISLSGSASNFRPAGTAIRHLPFPLAHYKVAQGFRRCDPRNEVRRPLASLSRQSLRRRSRVSRTFLFLHPYLALRRNLPSNLAPRHTLALSVEKCQSDAASRGLFARPVKSGSSRTPTSME